MRCEQVLRKRVCGNLDLGWVALPKRRRKEGTRAPASASSQEATLAMLTLLTSPSTGCAVSPLARPIGKGNQNLGHGRSTPAGERQPSASVKTLEGDPLTLKTLSHEFLGIMSLLSLARRGDFPVAARADHPTSQRVASAWTSLLSTSLAGNVIPAACCLLRVGLKPRRDARRLCSGPHGGLVAIAASS